MNGRLDEGGHPLDPHATLRFVEEAPPVEREGLAHFQDLFVELLGLGLRPELQLAAQHADADLVLPQCGLTPAATSVKTHQARGAPPPATGRA